MITKFNRYERIAGTFVGIALLGVITIILGVAFKRGWLEKRVHMEALFKSADSVHSGTLVQMSGLRAGHVDEVELLSDNSILVKFYVAENFYDRIRTDSVAQMVRPFVIGDKILDITVGTASLPKIPVGGRVNTADTLDLMDLLSGKKLGPMFETFGGLVNNLRIVAEAFLDPKRSHALIASFDQLAPLMKGLTSMSNETAQMLRPINKEQQLSVAINNIAEVTTELRQMLPEINKASPEVANDVRQVLRNMVILTEEFKKVLPAFQEVAPELPRASHRAIEALDEFVVLVKGMQKSFLLNGPVQQVRDDEKKRENEKAEKDSHREPAGKPK